MNINLSKLPTELRRIIYDYLHNLIATEKMNKTIKYIETHVSPEYDVICFDSFFIYTDIKVSFRINWQYLGTQRLYFINCLVQELQFCDKKTIDQTWYDNEQISTDLLKFKELMETHRTLNNY